MTFEFSTGSFQVIPRNLWSDVMGDMGIDIEPQPFKHWMKAYVEGGLDLPFVGGPAFCFKPARVTVGVLNGEEKVASVHRNGSWDEMVF